jgi:hypothetical protein
MLLDHLGEAGAARTLMTAIERAAADPALYTPDLGGRATTRQVTDAVIRSSAGKTRDAASFGGLTIERPPGWALRWQRVAGYVSGRMAERKGFEPLIRL